MNASPILQVQNVGKRFGGLQALSNIHFDLPESQILGLIGPNGAGKTTLFNVINGVYPADGGRVLFRGRSITGLPPYEVARLGIARTHQIVRPLNELTVRENVTVGACFGHHDMHLLDAVRHADEVLALVGLSPRAEQLAARDVADAERRQIGHASGWFQTGAVCRPNLARAR